MPEFRISVEADWLMRASRRADFDYEGSWIAVVGEEVIDHDRSLTTLAERLRQADVNPLFAFITNEPIV